MKNIFGEFFRKRAEKIPIVRRILTDTGGDLLSASLASNLKRIRNTLDRADDVVMREFSVGTEAEIPAALIYIEGMVDSGVLFEQVLKSSMLDVRQITQGREFRERQVLPAVKRALTAGEIEEITRWDEALSSVLAGIALLFIDGSRSALTVDATGWEHRGVQQPVSQAVIRGPYDAFTESARINISLVRRRLRDPHLKVRIDRVGRRSRTDVALLYIDDIIDPEILAEAQKRLASIDIDSVTESSYIEHFITDAWWSIFNTTEESERPDHVVSGLLEGQFAIISDNSPFVLLAPVTLNRLMHTPEDYYLSWIGGTFMRLIRVLGMLVALTLPALYIAMVAYHPQMLPTDLALSIAATRTVIPFPAVTEAFMMEIALELLREASLRLPGPLGPTIGIVGGLIIGEAAVRAGIVSPVMVIVVALTAISTFLLTTYSMSLTIRMLRFGLMILAATLGLFGVSLGMLAILIHLACLKSFGVSLLSPYSPLRVREMQDTWIRFPLTAMKTRPGYMHPRDTERLTHRPHEDVKGDAPDEA